MFLEVCEEQKIAYYWLSKEEKEDAQLRSVLRSKYKEWEQSGYSVCVFLSGKENLVELTKELLIHNKEVLARENLKHRREAQRER